MKIESKDKPPAALPAILCQQASTCNKVTERRNVGSRCVGSRTCREVEFRSLLALIGRFNQRKSAIQLINDFKGRFVALLGRSPRREQPSYSKVRLTAKMLRDQRIGGLLNPIVDEPVSTFHTLNQLLMASRPQNRIELFLRHLEDYRKRSAVGNSSKTSQLPQRILCRGRKPSKRPHQEINDLVGVTLGVDAVDIPGPARATVIECK
ncbi:hypothetical protein EDE08_11787 [Bradyrhizobium sp. R2.2-H]|nr:hypothetical protein EDE10_11759 [Bradyrhizobium sp. Y-H1]TCU65904.1 hypothetical protein EDE08_11787 [Bradyrhizobium sp. R2.2-H]